MSDKRLRQAERLFQSAADLPPKERAAYLDEQGGSDPVIRVHVERLLARFDHGSVASLDSIDRLDQAETDCIGKHVGPYKILQLAGEGGFGTVYLAEQQAPVRRTVALKIIKLGMDTKQVIARFEAERQALAMMDHPNIARVFDAGATDAGRPYFVMEFVNGVPITEYCDEHGLSTTQRLELFSQVCRAVQHAHQKGIIHRDIKPPNVLVTLHDATPTPKVIDFGIAKATGEPLTERTLLTEFLQVAGTPQYMSPEQAAMNGSDVDTRTDVYSLGVLLYELLTSTTPCDATRLRKEPLGEVQRIICEQVPPIPSRRVSTLGDTLSSVAQSRQVEPNMLSRRLQGDLDWIAMKALEKDRSRRYQSAADLADDLDRHLRHEAVLARAPTLIYSVGKFIRRNRVGVAMASLVAIVFVLGFVATTIGFLRARAEAKSAQAINAFFNNVLVSADPSQLRLLSAYSPDTPLPPGLAGGFAREESMTQMVRGASEQIEATFTGKPELAATAHETIGMTLRGLGRFTDAEPQLEAAMRIRRRVLGDQHPDTLRSILALGDLQVATGRPADGVPLIRSAHEGFRKILGDRHPKTLSTASILAAALTDFGQLDEAEPLFRKTLSVQRAVLGREHRDVLATLCKCSEGCFVQGRLVEGRDLAREVHEIAERTLNPNDSLRIFAKTLPGWWHLSHRNYARAESLFREGLTQCRRIVGEDHPSVYTAMGGLAHSLSGLGNPTEAEKLFRQNLAGLRDSRGDLHWRTLWAATDLARHLEQQGKLAEVEQISQRLVTDCIRAADEQGICVARNLNAAAGFLERTGKPDQAIAVLQQRLTIVRQRYGPDAPITRESLEELAATLRRRGRTDASQHVADQRSDEATEPRP